MGGVASLISYISDFHDHKNHMDNGGCVQEFMTALGECHPDRIQQRPDRTKRVMDVEACIRATAALRKCCGRNRYWFEHQYIPRLDRGLDEDLKPTPKQIEKEEEIMYRPIKNLVDTGATLIDAKIVEHHVRNGGCFTEFSTAMRTCGQPKQSDADVESCVKATAALRRCFAGNPGMFKHQYLWRLDLNPSPEEAKRGQYRWWTGMRRS
ncbi:unnamed protein product [Alopecurus aequalis]